MSHIDKKRKTEKRLLLSVLSGFLLLFAGGIMGAYSLAQSLPRPEQISDRTVAESTKIFDRTGEILLYEIHGEEKRTILPYSEIPEYAKKAVIAAEDVNFYAHAGLDGKGIVRAFFKNIASGTIDQGGSTITQQLIKNSLLTSERTFKRKIKEALLAIMVEKTYSKKEILGLYLNQVPFGSNAYGIESASQTFFAKSAKNITLAEAATLAAMLKATTYYSPYGSHKDVLLERRNWIIDRMAEEDMVSAEEATIAKDESLRAIPPKHSLLAPHFVLYIREHLTDQYGEDFVEKGGLRVTTTLDWKLQQEAEKYIKEGAEQNDKLVGAANASMVAVSPKTGQILAMVGSKDYWSSPLPESCKPGINCKFDPHVNVSLRFRQPGSSFKPFVYANAFKKGYTPETVLFDVPTEFNASCNPDGTPGPLIYDPKNCYHPQNYDGKFRGPVTLRQALAQSLNIPSVKTLYLAGIEDSIETASAMGIGSLGDPNRYGLALVLGGAEVSLLEMVSAYGVFAQDGILHPKTGILKIENPQGEILEEYKENTLPVLDTEIARTINNVLSDNDARIPVFSPRSSLYFSDRQVASKTGTTQDYRDAWVVGYTPSLVAGVWVGNNDNSAMKQSGLSVMVAGPIWHKFMESALKESPPEQFIPPQYIEPTKPVLKGFYRSGPFIKIDKISKKLATPDTPQELVEERGYGEVKSILSFVDKNDPLGSFPEDPFEEHQYRNWQTSIESWIAQNGILKENPPTESDDLHIPSKKPKIEFLLQSLFSGEVKKIPLRISSVFPLREVLLFLDEELVGSKTAPITSESVIFELENSLKPGTYILKTTVYDAVGNNEFSSYQITVSDPN